MPGRIFYKAEDGYIVHEPGSPIFWLASDPLAPQSEEHDTGGAVEPCGADQNECVLLAGFPLAAPVRDCTSRWVVGEFAFETSEPCTIEQQVITAMAEDSVVTKYVFNRRRGVTEFEFITPQLRVQQHYVLGSEQGFLAGP